MEVELEGARWNALRTKSRHEKVVEGYLVQKQIAVYLPKLIKPCDGKFSRKAVELPLFPGYIFVKPKLDQVHLLNFIPGSCGLLMERNRPGIIYEREIAAIRALLLTETRVNVHPGLVPGIRVKVMVGPFSGIEGILITLKNQNRLAIEAEILGQAISVEINRNQVYPVQTLMA